MNANEAKTQAYPIWQKWEHRRNYNTLQGYKFAQHLQDNHSHIMTFKHSGSDRHRVVATWVDSWARDDKAGI